MRKDKIKAYELRRQNKSYSEINRVLGIPKSTIASWFKNDEWSKNIKNKLIEMVKPTRMAKIKIMALANKRRWEARHRAAQEEAIIEFPKLKDNPLFLAGLMLYWAEGDRILKNGKVRLSNSDPNMIKFFYDFLRGPLNIQREKIFTNLLLYPDLLDEVQKRFWSKSTNIPLSQFKKSIYIKGRHPNRRLSYGVCNIYINSRDLKEKIMQWLELYQNYFVNNKND